MKRLAFLSACACVMAASQGYAARNNFDFKLGAFSDVPGVAQAAIASEANDLKRDKQERADNIKSAEDDNEFFGRTAEAGVVSIITSRIQTETTGSASSGDEIIQWTTAGGIRTVRFLDANTGAVRRTITFSVS